jgi:hypothetical protein
MTLVCLELLVGEDAFLRVQRLPGREQRFPPLRAEEIELCAFGFLVGHTARVHPADPQCIREDPGRDLSSSPDPGATGGVDDAGRRDWRTTSEAQKEHFAALAFAERFAETPEDEREHEKTLEQALEQLEVPA